MGDFGTVRAIVSLFAQASSVAQVQSKGPPATRSRKAESWVVHERQRRSVPSAEEGC
jgi:hypothetical protein